HAGRAPEVGDAGVSGDAGATQSNDPLRLADPPADLIELGHVDRQSYRPNNANRSAAIHQLGGRPTARAAADGAAGRRIPRSANCSKAVRAACSLTPATSAALRALTTGKAGSASATRRAAASARRSA